MALMRSNLSHRLQFSGALLLSSCVSAALGCASPYEPEGQFWPNSGSLTSGIGSTDPAQGSAPGGPTRASNGTAGDPTSPGEETGSDPESEDGSRSDIPFDQTSAANDSAAPLAGASTSNAGVNQGMGSAPAVGGGSTSEPGALDGPVVADSPTCSLSVSVTTTAPGGKYRPRNVGAIWIADSSGNFLKSLDVWGKKRLSHVNAWNAATKAAGLSGNKVDAVTSATLSTHRTHSVTWNCKDTGEQLLPDDTYRVYFEVTDSNNAGPTHFESFDKGPMAVTVQGTATNFNDILLTFTP